MVNLGDNFVGNNNFAYIHYRRFIYNFINVKNFWFTDIFNLSCLDNRNTLFNFWKRVDKKGRGKSNGDI